MYVFITSIRVAYMCTGGHCASGPQMMHVKDQLHANKLSKQVLDNITNLFKIDINGGLHQQLLNILGHVLKPHEVAQLFGVLIATVCRSKKMKIQIILSSHRHTGITRKQCHTQDL